MQGYSYDETWVWMCEALHDCVCIYTVYVSMPWATKSYTVLYVRQRLVLHGNIVQCHLFNGLKLIIYNFFLSLDFIHRIASHFLAHSSHSHSGVARTLSLSRSLQGWYKKRDVFCCCSLLLRIHDTFVMRCFSVQDDCKEWSSECHQCRATLSISPTDHARPHLKMRLAYGLCLQFMFRFLVLYRSLCSRVTNK